MSALLFCNGWQRDRARPGDGRRMRGQAATNAGLRAWQKREGWISLGAMAWPQGRSIRSKPDGQASLPGWEARLSPGLSWGIRGPGG
jgi:hypothetical protein